MNPDPPAESLSVVSSFGGAPPVTVRLLLGGMHPMSLKYSSSLAYRPWTNG